MTTRDQWDTLLAAARAFNGGKYFEAHEILEEALEDAPDALWDLYVGLVQIAVGYHKSTQGLWPGAAAMLERALHKLEAFAPTAAGINLAPLLERAATDVAALHAGRFDPAAFARHPPRLQLVPEHRSD